MKVLNFIIKVEVVGGSNIKETIHQMCDFSKMLECGVEADFNGFMILAFSHTDPDQLIGDYHHYLAEKRK